MPDIYAHFFRDGLPRGAFTYGSLPPLDCEGLTSMAVQWLKNFFTEQGSDPLEPGYGTMFARMLGGNMLSRDEMTEFVQIAVQEATQQQIQAQSQDLTRTPSQRIAQAELRELTLTPDGIILTVYLTNQTQESVSAGFQIPRT